MYRLPDSPQKTALIEYLEKKIKECDDNAWKNEGTSKEDEYIAEECAYRDILNKIR